MASMQTTLGLATIAASILAHQLVTSAADPDSSHEHFSSSYHNNQMTIGFSRLPISHVLMNLDPAITRRIHISDVAATGLAKSEKRMSITWHGSSVKDFLEELLAESSCRLVDQGEHLCILARSEQLGESPRTSSLAEFALELKLNSPMLLHVHAVPVQIVIDIVEGSSGIKVQTPDLDRFDIFDTNLVTVDSRDMPVRDILRVIGQQTGRKLTVKNGKVRLSKEQPDAG